MGNGFNTPNRYLENLVEIGGGLEIRFSNENIVLPELKESGFPRTRTGSSNGVVFSSNSAIDAIRAPRLERAAVSVFQSSNLRAIDFPQLSEARGIRMNFAPLLEQASFPQLKTIIANSIVVNDMPGLSLLNFPELETGGQITIARLSDDFELFVPKLMSAGLNVSDAESVSAHFPELTNADRLLFADIRNTLDVSFPQLATLTFSNDTAPQGLSFLNTPLQTIAFPNLLLSREGFDFSDNDLLLSISAPLLTVIGQNADDPESIKGLTLHNNPLLSSLDFTSLTSLRKRISVVNNVALCRDYISALEEDARVFPARASDDYEVNSNLPPAMCEPNIDHSECTEDDDCRFAAGLRCVLSETYGNRCRREN